MARALRIEYPGACYHVVARSVCRRNITTDQRDARTLISALENVHKKYNFVLYAYCIMSNHYHLLLETPDGNLSRGMQNLNSTYAIIFNKRHKGSGHLFQGRYKAILVEKEEYLLTLSRYIVLNPVRAGIVNEPEAYGWSSFREAMGMKRRSGFLETSYILSHFSEDLAAARRQYREFVYSGLEDRPPQPTRGIVLGSDGFLRRMSDYLERNRKVEEVVREERFCDRPSLKEIFALPEDRFIKDIRNSKICLALYRYGYSQAEVGKFIGLHYSTISSIAKQCGSSILS